MKKVLILQGIPGSGKNTWAREFIFGKEDWVRINRDDLRNMRGDYWVPNQESLITEMEDYCFTAALIRGFNVILDSTNLNPKTIAKFERIIETRNKQLENEGGEKYEIEYKIFNTPLNVCIERDSKRERPVGKGIITSFYNRYKDILNNE